MNAFTASNGVQIETQGAVLRAANPDGSNPAVAAVGIFVDALREFFQAEADERLGRWRWPENPEYVVYALEKIGMEGVKVIHETDGYQQSFETRSQAEERPGSIPAQAAVAYFDAHPEPKPWHDAEPGEVWELTVEGVTRTYASIASTGQNDVYVRFFPTHEVAAVTVGTKAPVISAGHRIFPEGKS